MKSFFVIQTFEIKILATCVFLLALANILNLIFGMPFWPITRLIDLGSDENLSAWFSSILLFIASLVGYDCWKVAKYKLLKNRNMILLFAFLLTFMSLDELARIHETIGDDLAKLTGLNNADIAKNANWVWLGGPVIILIFLYCTYALKDLFIGSMYSFKLLIAGMVSIVLGGVFLESSINFLHHEEDKLMWDIEIIVEEILEMTGSILILYALVLWRDEEFRSIKTDNLS